PSRRPSASPPPRPAKPPLPAICAPWVGRLPARGPGRPPFSPRTVQVTPDARRPLSGRAAVTAVGETRTSPPPRPSPPHRPAPTTAAAPRPPPHTHRPP